MVDLQFSLQMRVFVPHLCVHGSELRLTLHSLTPQRPKLNKLLTFSKTEPKLAVTTNSLFRANCNVISFSSPESSESCLDSLSSPPNPIGFQMLGEMEEVFTNLMS